MSKRKKNRTHAGARALTELSKAFKPPKKTRYRIDKRSVDQVWAVLESSGHTWDEKQKTLKAKKKHIRRMLKASTVPTRMPKGQWTQDTRAKLLGKRNDAEVHVKELLRKANILHHRERPIQIEDRQYFIDFHVQSFKEPRERLRVALEIDGGYHFTEEQQTKDRVKDSDLLKSTRVWSVLRIKWDVAMAMDSQQLARELRSMKIGEVRKLYDFIHLQTPGVCTPTRCTFPACLC